MHIQDRISTLAANMRALEAFGLRHSALVVAKINERDMSVTLLVGRFDDSLAMELDTTLEALSTIAPDEWAIPTLERSWAEFLAHQDKASAAAAQVAQAAIGKAMA